MQKRHKRPPRIAAWILKLFLPEHIGPDGMGDYEELFAYKIQEEGKSKARRWYWSQLFFAVPSFMAQNLIWSYAMLKNYIKITSRHIKRQKGYTFINISGLAVGMACCILILLWVQNELSYDKYHENSKRIYRITYASEIGGAYDHYALAPFPSAPAFKEEIPEVVAFTRLWERTGLITHQNNKFDVRDIFYADPDYFRIFTHEFIAGDPDSALEAPRSVVLTEDSALKIFSSQDPLGKSINLNGDGDLKVTGVIKNVPINSHFHFDYLVSMNSIPRERTDPLKEWQWILGYGYVLLEEKADFKQVENKIASIVDKYIGQDEEKFGIKSYYFLQKVTDIHLKSHLQSEIGGNGDIRYVYIFSFIAIFILIIACINFMNLSTARSASRGKEIGIRKVLGAHRKRLVSQFLTESVSLSLYSLILALILVWLILPAFNNLTGKNINMRAMWHPITILGFLGIVAFTGVAAGSYPAFYLSSFQPIYTLHNKFRKGSQRSLLRTSLVILQFTISICLMISTFIVLNQLNYMKNQKLGFDKEQVLAVHIKGEGIPNQVDALKNELKKNPNILEATYSEGLPGRQESVITVFQEGKSEKETHTFDYIYSDYDFAKTFGLEIIQGRDFSKEFASEEENAYLINETAAAKLGWGNNAVGKKIGISDERMFPIVGIVKDFHYKSLKETIGPLAIYLLPTNFAYLSIKMNTADITATLAYIETTWKTFEKERSFDYFFVDENFDALYNSEERLSHIITVFAVVAIFIACLGLFGLASFTAEQSTKEIGIRKVLGASVSSIMARYSQNFIKWVLISNIIAWPVSYFLMKFYWLANFPFRIKISVLTFAASGSIALLIALFTVSFQSIKAALANPIDSLRSE